MPDSHPFSFLFRYAAAKVQGEVLLQSLVDSGRLRRGVSLRVGWCQPGENDPSTMTASPSALKWAHLRPLNHVRYFSKKIRKKIS